MTFWSRSKSSLQEFRNTQIVKIPSHCQSTENEQEHFSSLLLLFLCVSVFLYNSLSVVLIIFNFVFSDCFFLSLPFLCRSVSFADPSSYPTSVLFALPETTTYFARLRVADEVSPRRKQRIIIYHLLPCSLFSLRAATSCCLGLMVCMNWEWSRW